MRSGLVLLLVAGLGACTNYQPVEFDGRGSWAEARAAATVKAKLVAAAKTAPERPIAAATNASGREGRHLVLPGESLAELANRYDVPVATLAKANAMRPPFSVHAGQVLSIPATSSVGGAAKVLPLPTAPGKPPVATARKAPRASASATSVIKVAELPATSVPPAAQPAMTARELEAARRAAAKSPPPLSGEGFLWPVKGEIATPFGSRPNGARNDGVNILAEAGTPVQAAENGVVVYAGDEIPGYGKMLLISHANGIVSAYAHNRDLLVNVGAVVKRGQQVASVGSSGGVGAPQLHFELRAGRKPLDPVAYLDSDETKLASTR